MKNINKYIPALILVPFVIGAIGYTIGGEAITDALYASFALYFVNPVSDVYNVFVDISRWTAALVTTAAILYALRTVFRKLFTLLKAVRKNSVAFYSDIDRKIIFDKSSIPIFAGIDFVKSAKAHIIMFEKDADSMEFYSRHKDSMKKSQIYIGLKELDSAAININTAANQNVMFFDIAEAVSRKLWKKIELWNRPQNNKIGIAIIGTGHLGRSILSNGLLINIFSKDQEIAYHLIGENDYYLREHEDFSTCNGDSIDFYRKSSEESWDIIINSSIVICAEEITVGELSMLESICRNNLLYYYSSNEKDLKRYVKSKESCPFGDENEIYTDANIRKLNLIKDAIEQNYEYRKENADPKKPLKSKEEEWVELDGFYKWSNISSTDYRTVIKALKEKEISEEELAEFEHIRWCRFHYMNHWKFGAVKKSERKEHCCLVNYESLNEIEKEKDRQIVRQA